MRDLSHIHHIVVKIGSSSLCDKQGHLNKEKMLHLINQIVYLKRKGMKITIVSSGAISSGMGILNLDSIPEDINKKQALASIGQAHLMQIYEELFSLFDILCAQILLTHDDFNNHQRFNNLKQTLLSLLDYDVIPIINENDALAFDEIKVGDNDTLSALILPVVNGQLLVIISDIDGLYDEHPLINKNAHLISDVYCVNEEIMRLGKDTNNHIGTGGMITKLKAAKLITHQNKDMAIINGNRKNSLIDLMEGKDIGTYFRGNINE